MSLALSPRRAILMPGPWVQDELWRRARAVPSLDLRFAERKDLIDVISGLQLITYTRVGSGTFVGSGGLVETAGTNVPRFDHNPTTGECLGLLVEESKTNLLIYSEDISQWLSAFNATQNLDNTTAPDGTNTADRLLETATTNLHTNDGTAFNFVASTVYTYSVFVKPIGDRNFEIAFPDIVFAARFARFTLSGLGSVQGTDVGVTASIQALPNGWYRCVATSTCTSGSGARMGNFINDSTNSRSYAGDTAKGIYIWGAQLEEGDIATSYIPTTNLEVTRSADVADIISAAIANNIRTLHLEFRSPASGTRGVVSLNDNTANQRSAVNTSGTDPRLVVVDGGIEQADIDGGTVTANVRTRVAVRINANDFSISVDGGTPVRDTSGTVPTVDRLMLGRTQAGEYLNGTLASVVGWREALPDSILRTLSA